ncbi:MAG: signal recognition particle-docking protein FtsY [Helicobacter sp.]|nr:signal recognition particle-docking protein FtsY [Helicobacter sp.]
MFSFLKIFKSQNTNKKETKELCKSISKDELEIALIESDLDYELIERLLLNLGQRITPSEFEVALLALFRGESFYDELRLNELSSDPLIYLIIGVNGAGKTTTIAKLANRFKNEGKKILLVAGDTFRAAAIEQLSLWGEKLGISVIKSQYGADPSSVAFDGINAAKARKMDICIIDTAGRLHNQTNLKNELLKVVKTCEKALNQPFYKIIVLDGTQGQSAINQAKIFNDMLQIDGAIITKLDGTSKGGAILGLYHDLKIPIIALGIGEGANDLVDFDKQKFIDALISHIFAIKKDEKPFING